MDQPSAALTERVSAGNTTDSSYLSPSCPSDEPVAVLGGFGVAFDDVRVQVHEPDLRYPRAGVERQLHVAVGGEGGVRDFDQELHALLP